MFLLSLGKGTIEVCQNNNLRVQRKNVWKIKFEKKFILYFWDYEQKKWHLVEK